MRIQTLLILAVATGIFVAVSLSGLSAAAPASRSESVGSMKRVIIQEEPPRTTKQNAPASRPAAAQTTNRAALKAPPRVDRDCSDFATRGAAQAFFNTQGPGDPHRLDEDKDGLACELDPLGR